MVRWYCEHSDDTHTLMRSTFHQSTPLEQACLGGHVDVCEVLVSHGAVLDPEDPRPMYYAAGGGSAETIEWLCSHGMELTVVMHHAPWEGDTPLHIACFRHYLDAAQCLYDHGAHQNIAQRNSEDKTPLHKAFIRSVVSDEHIRRCIAMVEWLFNHGAREAGVHQQQRQLQQDTASVCV